MKIQNQNTNDPYEWLGLFICSWRVGFIHRIVRKVRYSGIWDRSWLLPTRNEYIYIYIFPVNTRGQSSFVRGWAECKVIWWYPSTMAKSRELIVARIGIREPKNWSYVSLGNFILRIQINYPRQATVFLRSLFDHPRLQVFNDFSVREFRYELRAIPAYPPFTTHSTIPQSFQGVQRTGRGFPSFKSSRKVVVISFK